MEISVSYENYPDSQDTLIIKKKLAEGKFVIYHAVSASKKTNFALKVFPKNSTGTAHYIREKAVCKLAHPNVIRYIPITTYQSKFHALISELAPNGDFFELVTNNFLDTEFLMRTYFHQLVEGLEYIHSQGIAHLDLKLENLMLGSDYNLKIIDFDQAQAIKDERIKSAGTVGYRAPEVINRTCQDLQAADIYSLGVILYAFKAQEFPFVEVKRGGEEERVTLNNASFIEDNKGFWENRSEKKGERHFFSQELVYLLNGMMEMNPEKRFKLKDIKKSEWYQGPVLKGRSLLCEMRSKMQNFAEKNKRK